METDIITISYTKLSISIVLVLIPGLISAFLKLGLLKSILWGGTRTVVQLTLIGYVLNFIFEQNNIIILVILLTLMCYIASNASVKRVSKKFKEAELLSFISLWLSTFFVGSIVVGIIISPSPVYSPKVVIPIFGMLLGNSMNAISLSLDRFFHEVHTKYDEVETLLSFGASKWEAVLGPIKHGLRSGMTPTINSLMVVGIVSLPGMMTGQILGGVSPVEAVKYQIVVMLMITASVAIGSLIFISLSFKKVFNPDGTLNIIV